VNPGPRVAMTAEPPTPIRSEPTGHRLSTSGRVVATAVLNGLHHECPLVRETRTPTNWTDGADRRPTPISSFEIPTRNVCTSVSFVPDTARCRNRTRSMDIEANLRTYLGRAPPPRGTRPSTTATTTSSYTENGVRSTSSLSDRTYSSRAFTSRSTLRAGACCARPPLCCRRA
jgi:hypothetical protein